MKYLITSYIFIIGLAIGSFLNVCIYRIPRGISLYTPRYSFCPICKKRINWYDNIPLISYLILRGKCRSCGAPISIRYPIVEVLTAVSFILLYIENGIDLYFFISAIIFSLLLCIIFIDTETMLIPDLLSIPIGIVSCIYLLTLLDTSIVNRLIIAAVIFAIFYSVSKIVKGSIGYGDIKLLTFLSLLLGTVDTFFMIFIASLLGSVFGVVWGKRREGLKTKVPFGPFIGIGALIMMIYGREMRSIYQLVLGNK